MKIVTIDMQIGRKKLTAEMAIPENWNEVPSGTYPDLSSIYLKKPEEMNVYDKTVRAFVLLTLEHYNVVHRLDTEELFDLLPLVDWVFNRLDLSKNHIDVIQIDDIPFYGPADELENLRFAEFCVADTHYVNYAKFGNIEDLHRLAACLYRPAGEGSEYSDKSSLYRGDIREKFNDQLLNSRQLLMSRLSKSTLDGIYLFYASAKHRITAMYPEFFPPSDPKKIDKTATDQAFSWFDIYDDLRGDPKFGGPEKLEDEFLHTVLSSIERSKKTMKDLKRKHKIQ